MAKIICITTGLTGILNASLELVERLKESGHEVSYAAPRDVGDKLESHHVSFKKLPEIKLKYDAGVPEFKGFLKKINRFFYKVKNQEKRKKETLEMIEPKAFLTLVKNEKPDFLIIDIELHEYIIKAYSEQLNFVLLSQWFSLWNRKGLPYLLHDTIPGRGWKGSNVAIYFSWKIIQLKRWLAFSWQKIYTVSTDRRSVLLSFSKQEKFPLKWIKENYWPGPFSYDALPVISMTAEEMEFPHDPRPNHFYVGAMVNENRVDKIEKSNNGFSIEDVFDYQKKVGGKLIYCSVSTLLEGDLNFIEKLIQVFQDEKNWILIIGMGGLINETRLGKLPENVFAFSYVPQLKVLAKADLSINHGGIHTINECVFFKVPMLVYSGKKSDQNGCAARVDFHRLGLMADKDIDSPEQIREKINEVLTNKKYNENIEKMNQVFQKYTNEKKLERIIEKSIRGGINLK
ncbi:MAG: glycosyltransferase [Saprospiraceae bacterium]